MNIANIPNDKHEAEIHLKARRLAILELFEIFEVNNIDTNAYVLGAMHNEIEEVNELLNGGSDD